MTRVPCPDCGHRLRLEDDDDQDLAMTLHRLGGTCTGQRRAPKVRVGNVTNRISTIAEELGIVD